MRNFSLHVERLVTFWFLALLALLACAPCPGLAMAQNTLPIDNPDGVERMQTLTLDKAPPTQQSDFPGSPWRRRNLRLWLNSDFGSWKKNTTITWTVSYRLARVQTTHNILGGIRNSHNHTETFSFGKGEMLKDQTTTFLAYLEAYFTATHHNEDVWNIDLHWYEAFYTDLAWLYNQSGWQFKVTYVDPGKTEWRHLQLGADFAAEWFPGEGQ